MTTRTRTRTADDGLPTAAKSDAVDQYLRDAHDRIGRREFDLADLHDSLTESIGPAAATAGVEHVAGVVSYAKLADERASRGVGSGQVHDLDHRLFTVARQVFDQALDDEAHPFPAAGKLAAAQDAVTVAEQELATATADLEAAVDRADLDAIPDLRAKSQVTVPATLAAARADLLDVQAEQVRHRAGIAQRRRDTWSGRCTKLEDAIAKREAELERIRSQLAAAVQPRDEAAETVQDLLEEAEDLTAQRDQLIDREKREQTNRVRRLAGLPEVTAVPA